MYQALYRKYRPQTFDDLVGQQAVTATLKTQLLSGKLSHAYLFTGSRGTGKTSSAKILAKAVNCENPVDGNPCNCCSSCRSIDSGACMDVLEIDAASNNGVDNVRDLRDDAIYTPSQVKKRVYIIDEVHMLSISAFNALLKIIEEPPEHLLFILATTELHKVPATILSRCQRFSFRRISQEDIASRLLYVAYAEGLDLDESAARVLARLADGALRDGLSLLDQCASASVGPITVQRVYDCLGIAGIQTCGELMQAIAAQDTRSALSILDKTYAEGKDLGAVLDELICLSRDLLILQSAPRQGLTMLSGIESEERIKHLADKFSGPELLRMITVLQGTLQGFTRSAARRMDAELCIMQLCQPDLTADLQSVNARLGRLEQQIRSGAIVTSGMPNVGDSNQDFASEESVPAAEQKVELPPSEAPIGFWTDFAQQMRLQLKPPISGYFSGAEDSAVHGAVVGNTLELRCINGFTAQAIGTKEVLQLAGMLATNMLGRSVRAVALDITEKRTSPGMDRLLDFGRAHSTVVTIHND